MGRGRLAALMLLLSVPSLLSAATVRGRVVNGTGAELAESVEVHLVGFGEEGGEWDAPDGRDGFVFENVPGGPDNPLLMQTSYRGVSYNEQFTVGIAADTTFVIEVYDTTPRLDGIEVEELEIDLRRTGERSLRVDQVFRVTNVTEPPKTIVGAGEGTFRAFLPEAASDLSGLTLAASRGIVPVRRDPIPTERPDVVAIDYPIRPGFTAVAASYDAAYPGEYAFEVAAPYPIGRVVLVAPIDMNVEGDGLAPAHGGAQGVAVYTIDDVPEGAAIAFRASGGSAAPPEPQASSPRGRVFAGPAPFEDVAVPTVVVLAVVLFAGLVVAARLFGGGKP